MKGFLQVVREGFSEKVILELRPDRAGVQSPGVHVNWTGQTSRWRTGESQQSTVNLFIQIHPLGEVWEKWKGPWPTCRGRATGARQGRPNRGAGPGQAPRPGGLQKALVTLTAGKGRPSSSRWTALGFRPLAAQLLGLFSVLFLFFDVFSLFWEPEIWILCNVSHCLNLATYSHIFRTLCRRARRICCLGRLVEAGVHAPVQPLPASVEESWYYRLPRL